MGATLGLPLLPLFLEHRGGVPTIIGFIMASFFIAGVITQYFLGKLADRFGRRPVLGATPIAYGVAKHHAYLPISALWFALARAVQGASAGAIEVASMSAVAALFSESERGRAVSRIIAAQLLGLALGPIAGVVVRQQPGLGVLRGGRDQLRGGDRCVPHESRRPRPDHPTLLPRLQWSARAHGRARRRQRGRSRHRRVRAGWSLLLHAHHASTLHIRLSWTIFSSPVRRAQWYRRMVGRSRESSRHVTLAGLAIRN